MRVALWSPRCGSGWVAALEPHLGAAVQLELVTAAPGAGPEVDLDVYHVADDPAHEFVYLALLQRPGFVVLEEWNLHRLVYAATAGRGDEAEYRREARRAHGEAGDFCARQVLAGRGGLLPSLIPLNERVLEGAVGLAATGEAVRARAAARLRGRPVAHLPLPFVGVAPLPARSRARAELALARDARVVLALRAPGEGRDDPAVVEALDHVRLTVPGAAVVWTRGDDPDLARRLAAADVVVALEHPVHAGLGDVVPRALAAGRPTLVTAGSGAALEAPEGVVAHVAPGATQGAETVALLRRLLLDDSLRSRLGERARAFAAERSDPGAQALALAEWLRVAAPTREAALSVLAARRAAEGGLASRAVEEVAVASRELGLADLPPGVASLVVGLLGEDAR